jgi:hypothetical protein
VGVTQEVDGMEEAETDPDMFSFLPLKVVKSSLPIIRGNANQIPGLERLDLLAGYTGPDLPKNYAGPRRSRMR